MSKVLVISVDTIPITNNLAAGTGIRSWEIALGLSKYGHEITIAVPEDCHDPSIKEHSGVKIETWNYDNLMSLCEGKNAVFLPQGLAFLSNFFAGYVRDDLCVIVDVYDPNLIETLNIFPPDEKGIRGFSRYLTGIIPLLKRGDFFVCANNRQRYYYLGILNVLGRINPLTYNEKLIGIVPFGVPDEDPVYERETNVMRGSLVNTDDSVVLWFGGIYPWFDTITLIKAMDIAAKKNPKIKLVIMGAVHPRGHAPEDNYIKTLELSKQLGLYNRNVFFTPWRPYEERIYWYREADIGICTYPIHLETELSNRTRIVDMLWGGLPIISTEGDELSAKIKQYECGVTVKPNDPEELADVLINILNNTEKRKKMAENTRKLVDDCFRWEKVVRPLAEFLDNPVIAGDRRNELASNILLKCVDTIEKHSAYVPKEKMFYEHEIVKMDKQINMFDQQNSLLTQQTGLLNQLNCELTQQNNMLDESLKIKDKEIKELKIMLDGANKKLEDIYSTTTWKVFTKYQRLVDILLPSRSKRRNIYNMGIVGIRIIINNGFDTFFSKIKKRIFNASIKDKSKPYEVWIQKNEPGELELKRQKELSQQFNYKPLISIITPVYKPPPAILEATIESVIFQTYDNWEMCLADGGSKDKEVRKIIEKFSQKDPRIKVKFLDENLGISGNSNIALNLAKGDFVALLDNDDLLAPFALFEIVKSLNDNRELDLIYSDKDIVSEDGKQRLEPLFKPDWSPEIMLSSNYLTHLCVIRKSLVDEVSGFISETDGAQDWDLFLRVTEKTNKIHHISKVLYHWRESKTSSALRGTVSKPYISDAQRTVLHNHLQRLGRSADLTLIPLSNRKKKRFLSLFLGRTANRLGIWRIKWIIKDKIKISIIIPTKDNLRKLRPCVESILNKSSYQNFEIIIIDTGSKEPENLTYYNQLSKNPKIKIVNYMKSFNYSAVNNLGVKHATGEIVLFLNDDTEVITSDWLEEMAGWIQQEEIGIVGAKLLKPDNTIQHAGVVLGMQGFAGHPFAGASEYCWGPFGSTEWYRDYLAVTGACMMLRKKVFEEVGGFNESFILMGSDVELCLHIWKKGYRVVYTPFAKLLHYEASTRGHDIPIQDFLVSYEHYKPFLNKGDPYFNINLSRWNTIPCIKLPGEKETCEFVHEVLRKVSKKN